MEQRSSTFKPIDPERDEIRRYLERGNVMDSLTKLFIRVIKERPENPMEYIQNNIGVVRFQHDKYERLQKDLQTANNEIERLKNIIMSIDPNALEPMQSAPAMLNNYENLNNTNKVQVTAQIETAECAVNQSAEYTGESSTNDETFAVAIENCHITDSNTTPSVQSVQIQNNAE